MSAPPTVLNLAKSRASGRWGSTPAAGRVGGATSRGALQRTRQGRSAKCRRPGSNPVLGTLCGTDAPARLPAPRPAPCGKRTEWSRARYAKRAEFDRPPRTGAKVPNSGKRLSPPGRPHSTRFSYMGGGEKITLHFGSRISSRLRRSQKSDGRNERGSAGSWGPLIHDLGRRGQAAGGSGGRPWNTMSVHGGVQSEEMAVGGREGGPVGCGTRQSVCSHQFESRCRQSPKTSGAVGNGRQQSLWGD